MTTTRILPGILLLVATAGPVAAQRLHAPAPIAEEGMPPGRPAGARYANPTALERVTTPLAAQEPAPPPRELTPGDPVGLPVGPGLPVAPGLPAGLPPGAYPSPYYTDGPGCRGPLGRNGRIGYELYAYTGATWALGEGRLARQLGTGWMVGGGGRSLFFNTTHDAAWIFDLGLSYQYNRGSVGHHTDLVLRQPPDPFGNPQPDVISGAAIRELHRTNFNYAIGRDWWMWGPGSTGLACDWNLRVGGVIGGRWGTAHVDLLPQDLTLGDYQRRHGVTHGVFIAPHVTVEVPMGSSVWFAGLRAEWGYDWMNLVPPLQGNLHNINVLLTAGLRY